jgi:hypothetical protein
MIQDFIRHVVPERFRPIGYLTHLTRCRTAGRVLQGPFAGTRYVSSSIGSAYIPKLLGTYERELAPCVETICRRAPAMIIDIGAAEGYYAIGLARSLPETRVIGFELDHRGREALAEMSALNGVMGRVAIRGRCDPSELALVLQSDADPVVICDVEGDEERLLDPASVPPLRRATILVELHEFIIPGVGEKLRARFAGTHRIEEIVQADRDPSEFPWRTLATSLLPGSYLRWAVSEWRPARMSWLWMVPNSAR